MAGHCVYGWTGRSCVLTLGVRVRRRCDRPRPLRQFNNLDRQHQELKVREKSAVEDLDVLKQRMVEAQQDLVECVADVCCTGEAGSSAHVCACCVYSTGRGGRQPTLVTAAAGERRTSTRLVTCMLRSTAPQGACHDL